MLKELNIAMTIDIENKTLYIGEETSSGAKYKYNNIKDLAEQIKFYLENYYSNELKYENDNQKENNDIVLSEEKIIVDLMTKLLNISNNYLELYCENFDEYVLSEEEIKNIDDEEERKRAIELKETDTFLKKVSNFIKEYKKEKNLDRQDNQIENEEESI